MIAGALPAAKVGVLRDLQARGRTVAMVGDGINDGPALATADLGLALGSGTDVAITAADLILLRDDLGAVADGIGLARATFTTIRRNIVWAFGYNVAAIPLAAAGLLNPIIAAGAMALSSAFVVWNSVGLRRFAAPRVTAGTPRAWRSPRRRWTRIPPTPDRARPETGHRIGDDEGTADGVIDDRTAMPGDDQIGFARS